MTVSVPFVPVFPGAVGGPAQAQAPLSYRDNVLKLPLASHRRSRSSATSSMCVPFPLFVPRALSVLMMVSVPVVYCDA
jgi:hypothetical protein